MKTPAISVCIPLYQTERYLAQCLRSVLLQDFSNFEVVVCSDASNGVDENGWPAKKIIKSVLKECSKLRKKTGLKPVPLRFVEHSQNRGLFEVRRTLAYEAHGQYITQCDSDDALEQGALAALYAAATSKGQAFSDYYDIVHGFSTAGSFDENGNFIPANNNVHSTIHYGEVTGREIYRGWLLNKFCSANTWGKLIKRDIYLAVYDQIPYTECNLAEDVLIFFFISQFAKSYIGIKEKVYRYRVNVGMTSANKITNLQKWKMTCSAASVFSVISTWTTKQQNEQTVFSPLPDELEALKGLACYYVANNLQVLSNNVELSLQASAREMLNDYWGQELVDEIEKTMQK